MKIILSLTLGVLLTANLSNAQFFGSFADLEGTSYSSTTPENFYQTETELDSAVMAVYANLRRYDWGEYADVQEVSSDAMVAPTRGGDWDDGGTWRRLQEHTWTVTDNKFNIAWSYAYRGIASANSTLSVLNETTVESDLIPIFKAETRFLRAFYYWELLDLFRNVPLVTDPTPDPNNPPVQNTPLEVFDFIVAETIAALADLEATPADYGRASKGAANALLATVYLNAEVYTGTAMWSESVAACDAVINSGLYDLMPTFDDVFALENEGAANTENIFVVVHEPEAGFGFLRQMATLHYSQLPSSPWNGFAVLADYYNRFDAADARIDQLLVGQQYVLGGPAIGDSAFQRDGTPLVFTVEFPLTGATESDGVRILKWPVDPNASGADAGNDFAIFRYSHILLAKAEAQFMLGNTAAALALVNMVRARNFDPDQPLTSVTRDDIFDERGYELLWEGFRRQDQIRTGHFLEAWSLKSASDGAHREIFPIPQVQLDANPNLRQNPGYGTGVSISLAIDTPTEFSFSQNYPNPFNPITTIPYSLPKSAMVSLSIYNIAGQLVETLVHERKNAGFYSVQWNAGNVGSGLYFYRIEAGEYKETKKCLILK